MSGLFWVTPYDHKKAMRKVMAGEVNKYNHIESEIRNLPQGEMLKVLLIKILEELAELNDTVDTIQVQS